MTFSIWISFILASLLIIATPGPAVTLLVTTSISQGKRAAFSMIPGTLLGDLTAMILSFAGVGALLLTSPTLFNIMKWVGAFYLVYLGIRIWIDAKKRLSTKDESSSDNRKTALKAFWVTVLNPKSILFFIAFMPQFINNQESFLFQIFILGATFLGIGLLNDILYTILADKAAQFMNNHSQKWLNRIGAINLFITGIVILGLQNS